MAKILSNAGIVTGLPVEAEHVSQSVNALTGAEAYDITISGSLVVNGLTYPYTDGPADLPILTDGNGNLSIRVLDTVPTASYVSSSNVDGPHGFNSVISSSYAISASQAIYSVLASSSLFAINALQSENSNTAISSSYTLTASYALNGEDGKYALSSSHALTASYVTGNITTPYKQYFSGSIVNIGHNFNSEDIIVGVYQTSGSEAPTQLIPSSVVITDSNNVLLTFSRLVMGYAIITDGKGISDNVSSVSSSYALTASYALNGGGGGGGTYTSTYVTSNITAEKDKIYVFTEPTPYTLNLPPSPENGDSILISNRSGIPNNIIGRNGELIMGLAEDMELNVPPAAFMFTYASGTQGWVITGAGSGGGGSITGSLKHFITSSQTGSFAVTSSNQFIGSQFFTGSLIPEAVGGNGIYDVGSQTHPWKDLYISTSSLKFVRDAVVIADLNGEDDGVRIGNIFIGTGSISVVSGSGDDMTVVGSVISTEISGGIITPVPGDAVLPSGSISSSAQIAALGFVTSSLADTGSFITTSSLLEYLPTGSVSSSAQLDLKWVLGANGINDYTFNGPGLSGSVNDPSIYLTRGETYRFENNMGSHPFRIQSTPNGSTGTPYNDGITNNDVTNGTLIWEVQFDSPDKLYYQCTAHPDMGGEIIISSTSTILPDGVISSSQQINDLGFISASSNGVTLFSGSTSFLGDTSFTGSTTMSGSLTVIDNQGFRVEGNTVLTGSNLFQGTTILTGDSFTIQTTSSFKSDVDITGSLTVTGGITGSLHGTSSVSLDTLLFDGKDSATFATTGSNDFKSSQYISGSVVIAPSEDPGTSNLNSTYLFTSASNFGEDECDFYYRNKGILWDQEWLEYGVGSGLIFGGVVTFSGTDLYVSPGGGLVVNYNAETGSANAVSPTQVKWGPITSSATYLTSSQYSHLYIDENGDLQQQIDDFTTQQYLEKIPLGTLGHLTNAYIDAFGEEKQTTYAGPAQANQFIRAFGPLKQQGYDLSPITSSLGFNAASGITYKLGGFYSKDPNNPSVYDTPALASTGKIVRVSMGVGDTFIGDINAGNFYDTIDPTKYDDGSGTLVNISGSTTTIQRVFLGPTSERFYVYYGQETYDSVSTALQNLTTEAFTESLTTSKSLTFVGYLVVKANTTDLADESCANIINAGLFRNTAGSSGGGTSTISNLGDITDVDITGPVTGEYLKYNAGIWENSEIQYSEVNNAPSGIVSSSAQLESLGVVIPSGSNTTFSGDVVISGSNSTLEVQGDLNVTGSLTTPVQTINPTFQPTGWTIILPVSTGNFFETTLQPSSAHEIIFGTGGGPGQTVNLKINQNSSTPGTITWAGTVEFPDGFDSGSSTGAGDVDVFSFVTFDGSIWYGTGLKNFS